MTTAAQKIPTGYKQTEIGVIPADWEVKQLGELFDITSSKRVFQSEWKTRGVPFYRARELAVLSETGSVDNELFISPAMYQAFKNSYGVPQTGDVLVTGVGTLGKVYVVPSDHEFYFKDGNIIWFKIAGKVNSNFLRQLYLTRLITKQIEDASAGTTVGTYTITGAKKTTIPYPSKEEQFAIADALASADALITKLEALIEKKKHIKQGAMQESLTGKRRLPGFSGEWETKKLGELLDYEQPTEYLVKHANYSDDFSTPVLTAGKTFVLGYTAEETGIFQNLPTIIFDDFTTAIKYVDFPFKAKSSAMKMLIPRSKNVNLKFVFAKMQMIDFQLGDHKRYWISEYQNIEIATPKPDEQTAIASVLSDMDTEIEKLESQLTKYQNIKQGMMQTLLTGKIRLIDNG